MNSLYSPSNSSTHEQPSPRDYTYLGKKHRLYVCLHENCSSSLKSKKQKVHHHDKLDIECRAEKTSLLALLEGFSKAVLALSQSIDAQKMKSSYAYKTLVRQYESSRSRIINQEQLDAIFVNNDTLIE